MSTDTLARRGGAAVATMGSLPGPERRLVAMLRLWAEGGAGRAQLSADLPPATLGLFRDLVTLLAETGRRPLLRHALDCHCVGSDEAVFAHFVTTAATGEREDAMMIATLLMRVDMAPLAVSLAQSLGLALARGGPRPSVH